MIANTLSITIAQRVREFATLRTLGATRRQVLGSVILEAFVTGVFASVVGLFVGFGFDAAAAVPAEVADQVQAMALEAGFFQKLERVACDAQRRTIARDRVGLEERERQSRKWLGLGHR